MLVHACMRERESVCVCVCEFTHPSQPIVCALHASVGVGESVTETHSVEWIACGWGLYVAAMGYEVVQERNRFRAEV